MDEGISRSKDEAMPATAVDADQLAAELELERAEHSRWKTVAHMLANSLRARLDGLDLVELEQTLRAR